MDKKDIIRQELSQKGLPADLVDLISIGENDKVEDITAKIKAIKTDGKQTRTFDDVLTSDKEYQAEFDRRVTKALQTQKEKMDSQKKDEGKPTIQEPSKTPEIVALQEQLKAITDTLKTVTEQTTRQAKLSEVKEKFKAANLPESWLSRVDLTGQTSVEDQLKNLKTDYDEIKQSVINDAIKTGSIPDTKKGGAIEEKDIENYIAQKEAAKMTNENSPIIKFK